MFLFLQQTEQTSSETTLFASGNSSISRCVNLKKRAQVVNVEINRERNVQISFQKYKKEMSNLIFMVLSNHNLSILKSLQSLE